MSSRLLLLSTCGPGSFPSVHSHINCSWGPSRGISASSGSAWQKIHNVLLQTLVRGSPGWHTPSPWLSRADPLTVCCRCRLQAESTSSLPRPGVVKLKRRLTQRLIEHHMKKYSNEKNMLLCLPTQLSTRFSVMTASL